MTETRNEGQKWTNNTLVNWLLSLSADIESLSMRLDSLEEKLGTKPKRVSRKGRKKK